MDIPQVLAVLHPGEDWGPCAHSDSTYDQFVAGWNLRYATADPPNPPPAETDMLAAWDTIVANAPAQAAAARRAAAVQLLLTSEQPRDVALRAFLRDLYTAINDLRELLPVPLPRVLESDIITRVVTGIGNGLGDISG